MYRLLGLFAHPDDEILGPGATIAKYASAGVHIEWVLTTRGEAGEIAPGIEATAENLGQVREQEMHCAAHTLGIKKLHFLGYRDSGMAGTAENQHPAAYINAPDDEVIAKLVAIMRNVRPHVALTFEPYGGYGHPDHIAIHKHTHAAISAAADANYRPDLGAPWQTPRLFYPLLRLAVFNGMREKMAAQGMDLSFFEQMQKRREKGWPDDKWHGRIATAAYFNRKWTAFHCHATQFAPDNLFRRLPETDMAALFTHEYFAQAIPEPAPGTQLDDLFAGLDDSP